MLCNGTSWNVDPTGLDGFAATCEVRRLGGSILLGLRSGRFQQSPFSRQAALALGGQASKWGQAAALKLRRRLLRCLT